MVYEKDKIKKLVEYKDNITDEYIKNSLEWLLSCYNEYYVNSEEYERYRKEHKTILNKYYNLEDERVKLKEELVIIKRRYKRLKESCKNLKDVI